MSATNISILKEHVERDVRNDECCKSAKAGPSMISGSSRFPSVDSVLDDIDRLLVKRTRVA